MKKEKVKRVFKKILWFILWSIVMFLSIDLAMFGFRLLINNTYSVLGVLCLLASWFLSDLSLYLYSYKIYFGKYNWYKFFKEREKQQQKQNNLDWKEYCNSLKNK